MTLCNGERWFVLVIQNRNKGSALQHGSK
uniref:Uncharacterized protein n=1 Tax=Arundo donax TaxID=35708 RepID=A0A0A9BX50_ARUDO